MADITTVTFNYILVIVFLFPLNIGVSPCFHCTVLVPVYMVYTSCFHNTIASSSYRWHTSCLHHAGVTSFLVWTCGFNLFLKFVISQELIGDCTRYMFLYDRTWSQLHHEEVTSSANSCANCHYDTVISITTHSTA